MVDPRQQTMTGGVTDREVLPNEHRTKSKTLTIAVLAAICLAGSFSSCFLSKDAAATAHVRNLP